MSNGNEEETPKSTKGVHPVFIIIIAAVCLFIGYLSTKVFSLEKQLSNHYDSINTEIGNLKQNMRTLETTMNNTQNQLKDLCTNIKNNFDSIRKERQDLHQEILDEIRKQQDKSQTKD
ncbi:MAG: hypothetical protein ACYTDW_18445 [Planctomycetota bacterium]|jgi:predicted PurR-regulated permease PerM